ncbi:MAG: hypothetical protein J0M16_02105 [Gammaproteobacteria bacterium]|nr:hypothetical protein [Gammaproteobacteria bacterium]
MQRTRFPSCATRRLAALIPGAALLSPAALAQVDWAYTSIADSSAEFASFSVPAINEAGKIAFVATFDDSAEGQALYRYDGPGVLTPIATTGPNGTLGRPGRPGTATGTAVNSSALTDGSLQIALGVDPSVPIPASIVGSEPGQTADSAWAKANAINNAGLAGLAATASTVAAGTFSTITSASSTATYNLVINGVSIYAGANNLPDGDTVSPSEAATQINLFTAQTGVSATVSGVTLTLSATDGRNVVVAETLTQGPGATLTGTGLSASQEGTLRGAITLSADRNITLTGTLSAIGFSNNTIPAPYITAFVGNPSINQAGVVTFTATLSDATTSVLAGSGNSLAIVANTADDGLTSLDSTPFISDTGDAVVVRGVRASDGARVILKGTGAAAPTVLVASTGAYDPVDVAGINDDGAVAFEATTGSGATRGIYRTVDGTAVTTITEVPAGGAEDLQALDIDNNGAVTWSALDNLGIQRLYTTLSGSPVNFVNTAGPFDTLGATSVAENGSVAFEATLDLGLNAIFAGGTSLYESATAVGDPLLGLAITALDIGPDAVTNSGAFVFRASRFGGTSGIYVAVGTPVDNSDGGGSAVDPLVLGALLLLAARRRRP